MPSVRKFDELNNITKSTPEQRERIFREYFRVMELDEEDEDRRVQLAEKLYDVFAWLFVYVRASVELGREVDSVELSTSLAMRYKDAVDDNGAQLVISQQIMNYINEVSDEIAQTTAKNQTSTAFISDDRAIMDAEEESNSIWNYSDYEQHIKDGYTQKEWVDMHDGRVRRTHRIVGGTKIGIMDVFQVGSSLMRFPRDTSLGADSKEIVRCRCKLEYYK